MARFYSNENFPLPVVEELHREQPAHSGIIVCTLDLDFAGQAGRIHAAVTEQEDLHGQLLRVNRPAN